MKKFFLALAVGAASALVFVSCNSANESMASVDTKQEITVLPRLENAAALPATDYVAVSMTVEGQATIKDSVLYSKGEIKLPKIAKGKKFTLSIAGFKAIRTETEWTWAADTTGNTSNLTDSSILVVNLVPKTAPAAPSLTAGTTIPSRITTTQYKVALATPAAGESYYYTTDGTVPAPTNSAAKLLDATVSAAIIVNRPADTTNPVKLQVASFKTIPGLGYWGSSVKQIDLKFGGEASAVKHDSTLASITVNGTNVIFTKTQTVIQADSLDTTATGAIVAAVATDAAAIVTIKPSATVTFGALDTALVQIEVDNAGSLLNYTLRIPRKHKHTAVVIPVEDTTLSGLTVTPAGGTPVALTPAFSKGQLTYTATVDAAVTSATVVGTPTTAGLEVTYLTGRTSGTVTLATDSVVKVTVTNSRANSLTYTVAIKHKAVGPVPTAHDTTLKSLTINGKLHSAPVPTTLLDTVESDVASATVVAVPNDLTDTVYYSTTGLSYAKTAPALTFTSGKSSTYFVRVKNSNGNKLDYAISVFCKAGAVVVPSTDTLLSALTTDRGALSPTFDALTQAYSDTIDDTVTAVTLKGTPNATGATVAYNGNISGKISVSTYTAGQTRNVAVKVTNGTESLTYMVALIKRKAGGGGTGGGSTLDLTGTETFLLEQGKSYTVNNTCSSGNVAFTKVWDATDLGAINVTVDGTAVTGSYYASSAAGATFTLVSTLGNTTLKCQ